MKTTPTFSGVIAPVLTPLGEDGAPDLDRFVEHCEWLMEEGCTGLAPFGTTSEANSLGIDERMEMLEEVVEARHSRLEADAGHGHVLARRHHPADRPCRRTRLRRGADAAAVLLQEPERGGPVPLLRRGDRRGRRRGPEGLPLSYPADRPGRLPAVADRAAAQGISDDRGRPQGLLGRLEQHQGDPRRVPRLRGVSRFRSVPARRPAQRRRRAASRRPATSARAASARSTTTGRARTPTSSRPTCRRCASRSSNIR